MIERLIPILIAFSFPIIYQIGVFKRLGLEFHEAAAIILVPFMISWLPPVKIADIGNISLYVNFVGFLLPFFISLAFIYSGKVSVPKLLLGAFIIGAVTYFGSYAAENIGVVVRTILLVPFIAAYYGLRMANRGELAPLTYSSATMGTFVGADVLRMQELIKPEGKSMMLAIGGGGLKDAIFLSGTVAVIVCLLFMLYALTSFDEE